MKILIQPLCLLLCQTLHLYTGAQVPALNSYPPASAAIYLDFDGHTVEGTSWNWSGSPIACASSGLNAAQITHVFNRVAEDFRPFNINITTDSIKFLAAPIDKRMRVIITTTSSWYGTTAGGVAFIESFTSGDDTPCFVFSGLFGYNLKKISEAISHESGHTLGLYHQSQYDANCNKITDYYGGQGTGEIGWAPIMGVGYSRNFTLWGNGPNSLGCTNFQSDLDIITSPHNGFGYREDDHPKTFDTATLAIFSNNQFDVTGVIGQNTDEDIFRFSMPGRGRFQLNAVPYNVGTGNAGSNLDMQITLYNGSQTLLNIFNPGTLLNSVADTILNPGFYYLKVEGKGNLYAPAYASLGSYSVQASIEPGVPLVVHKLELGGLQNGDMHQFNWIIDADEPLLQQILEVSIDGKDFIELTAPTIDSRTYVYRPSIITNNQYRLKVLFDDDKRYYSNIITLRQNEAGHRPKLLSNFIGTNTVTVTSQGKYSYALIDLNGKMISRGQLINGINNITIDNMVAGMYVIRFSGNDQVWTDKLLRQ
ncbi:MAG: T9SS type A sorting domain-containing protein [Chitinophagaceae bacterium]